MSGTIVHAAHRAGRLHGHHDSVGARVLATLRLWHRRRSERAHLANLDARLVADMGLTPGAAARESAKPFWRA